MPDPLQGRDLDGRYRLEAPIGRGGMGEVYRARHLLMDLRVAVKVLARSRAGDPEAARRFLREARQTFRFDHPNCVRVTDCGATEDGLLYLVMEYLDGRSAGAELEVDGPMSPERVAHVCRQVCDALAHAHAMGVVHRDIKPDNVMLIRREGDPDFVKVLDFGLAKLASAQANPETAFSISPLTREGMVFGTPEYMSPEQATGAEVDPRSDLYSVGVLAYELCSGAPPFSDKNVMKVLARQVGQAPERPTRRRPDLAIPLDLEALILACLEKLPERRPAGARELSERFAAIEAAGRAARDAPASPVAASETMELAVPPSDRDRSQGAISLRQPAPSSISGPRAGRRHVGLAAGAAAALAVVAVGAAAALWPGADRPEAALAVAPDPAPDPAPEPAAPRPAAPKPAAPMDPDPEPSAPTDPDPDADPDPSEIAGSPEPTRPERPRQRPDPTPTPESAARAQEVSTLLAQAESARAAQNHLKQLAHADAALALEPGNRRALRLFGDALVRTGHKDRGCRILSRFPRESKRAGCSD